MAAGAENFKSMMGFMYNPQPPTRGMSTGSRYRLQSRSRDVVASRVRDRRKRIQRSSTYSREFNF